VRPLLHFTPRRGWMNDPNGLIQLNGVHHLFYQANPHAARFESIHWGHAVSTDLVHWRQLPAALTPGEPGTPYDRLGCFSGVAVEVDGRFGLLYTGVADSGVQLPCLAWANDDALTTFVKDPANPVIAQRPFPDADIVAFRDHSVTRQSGRWRQLIGGGTRSHGGVLFVYRSDDFKRWSYSGLLTDSAHTPIPGPIWECPDVFTMNGRSAMIVSVLDGADCTSYWAFGEDRGDEFRSEAVGVLDVGDRFYAPQSYETTDHRRVMLGWLRTQLDPSSQDAEWLGTMSLPREVTISAQSVDLAPARELEAVRGAPRTVKSELGSEITRIDLDGWPAFELRVEGELTRRWHSVTFEAADRGDRFVLPASAFTRERSTRRALTVIFDCGIVEAFLGGQAGAWSNGALTRVGRIVVEHAAELPSAMMTVWPLA
jgi:beta-fructofuranosidase